jgi:hypothetical protein
MRNRWLWLWWLVLLVPVVGCKGCTQSGDPSSDQAKKEEEAKKKRQRLVADELRTLPFATESAGNLVKPGHWYQIRNKVKANFGDESLTAAVTVTDREGIPLSLGWGSDSVDFKRNVSLAVGQEKAIDVTLMHPDTPIERTDANGLTEKVTSSIRTRYSLRGIGTPILEETFPVKFLEGYQYDLVVMSRDLSRHTFWRGLDCIVWRTSDDLQENRLAPHRIVDMTEEELASHFPSQLATMTSISHIVINDVSLSVLTEQQQNALADWLHFGGTLIINGPEAVGSIETSQLKEWVPLVNTADGDWSEESQLEFDNAWTIRIAGGEKIRFQSDRKIPVLTGTLVENAEWVPMLDGLVAERLIGQGRVVMTTFPLTDAAFIRWPSYSSLIHNAILRKPHRTPTLGDEARTQYAEDFEGTERNPLHNTRLRLWARDLDPSMIRTDGEVLRTKNDEGTARFPSGKKTSLGAWNSESRIAVHATNCLRESSGITVPQVSTIMKLLLGYLIVLVPINWVVFRLMGRVEWAWIAAPIIALAGAAFVARSVQLDVGFSRSQTTFGFLECHNNYPRGLLSNFHALYTSLSTNYQAVYKEGEGLVVPALRANMRTGIRDNQVLEYWNADERGSGLQRFPVLSNSTGILQTEELVDFTGPIRWNLDRENLQILATNDLGVTLRDVGVLGLNDSGELMTSWIGSIEPGQSVREAIAVAAEDDRWFSQWNGNPLLKKPAAIRAKDGMLWTDEPVEDIYMGAMLMVIAQRYPLETGECIALGWTEANPSRIEISPTTVQTKHKTLVLMHIRSGVLGDVEPDTRIFATLDTEEQ